MNSDNDKNPIIFSDFDGTFAAHDIGHRLFTHFSNGRNKPLVDDWKKGLISSRECLTREAAMVMTGPDEIYRFIDIFELREGAFEFYNEIKGYNIPFYIVSDGIDIYIDHMLKKIGMTDVSYFSNKGILKDGRIILEFPYDNGDCRRCGSCKGARINEIVGTNRKQWEVIFIGDGLSDICAIPYADIIFARGDLLEYCHSNGNSAIEYENFFDILNYLRKAGKIAG